MQRNSFIGTASALAVSAFAAPLAAQTKPAQLVVAPLAGPDVAGLYYASQQGWFKDAGLDVVIQPVANGSAGMAALIGGTINVGYANVLSVATAHTKGIPVLLVAPGAGYHAAAPVARLLVSGDGDIRTVKDLAGKTIGVPLLGDINTIGVEGLLDKAGVARDSVHFTEIPPPSMPPALQAKRVDAISIYEPFVSAALAQGARSIASPYDSVASNFLIAAWTVEKTWAANNRAALMTFASVLNRGSQYANAHYLELTAMISDFSKMPANVLGKLAFPTVPPTLNVSLIQPVIDAAARYHAIPAGFPAKELVVDGVAT